MSSALENFQNAKSKFAEAGQPVRVAGSRSEHRKYLFYSEEL